MLAWQNVLCSLYSKPIAAQSITLSMVCPRAIASSMQCPRYTTHTQVTVHCSFNVASKDNSNGYIPVCHIHKPEGYCDRIPFSFLVGVQRTFATPHVIAIQLDFR